MRELGNRMVKESGLLQGSRRAIGSCRWEHSPVGRPSHTRLPFLHTALPSRSFRSDTAFSGDPTRFPLPRHHPGVPFSLCFSLTLTAERLSRIKMQNEAEKENYP